jgi:hypothetical protein
MLSAKQIFAMTMLTLLLASSASAQVVLLAYQAEVENIMERREEVTNEKEQPVFPLTLVLGTSRFTLSGLIEVEGSIVHREGGDEEDDLRLCTVQIGMEAELTPWLGGHVTGLWEEDETEPMKVDEAVLTLTSPWKLGEQAPGLGVGRQYLPFGRFHSNMISDPLTLALGETHTTAALLNLESALWTAKGGAFEGSVDDGDDGIDSWVAAVEVIPQKGVTFGASWISDLAESDAELVKDEAIYGDEVPGWSVFAVFQHGRYGLTAEYLAAAKKFEQEQVDCDGDLSGRRPEAWNIELSWQPVDRLQLAARYEAAHDYQDNVNRYGATVSCGLCDFALLAFEYLHADAKNTSPENTFTAQLAVEF